jgi:cyclophilin family peptidyl-prolyl cis-trans isomerase/HEAT repeat protein
VLRAEDRRLEDEPLRAALDDEDPAVRLRAVAAIARIGAPGTRERLQRAAGDDAPAVRAEAALGLGLLGDPLAAATVAALAADVEAGVRARAAEALGRLAAEGTHAVMAGLLDDADAAVRAEACLAAWKFSDAGRFVDPLIARASDGEAIVRFGAAYALGRLGASRSAPPTSGSRPGSVKDEAFARVRAELLRLIGAPESEIRMQAARGLANPANAAETAAAGALVSDRDPGVRVNAVRAFGYPGLGTAPFVERALKDPNAHVVRAAVEALGRIGTSDAARLLWEGLSKTKRLSAWLFEPAAVGLAQTNPDEFRNVVEGLASNADPIARAAAPPLLASRAEPWTREILAALLRDPAARVQAAAIPVAAQGEGLLSTILGDLVAAADPIVRAAVADAAGARLAKSNAPAPERADAFALLKTIAAGAAGDLLPDARLAALEAAARGGGGPEARAILEDGLRSGDWLTRRRAAELALEVLKEDRFAEIGAASERAIEDYVAILEWAAKPRAAIVAIERPGFKPGRFTVRLDTRNAPLAAWNFARLAETKFFDGLVVHRVVPNFVVQDGDPRGDGSGGPGWVIRDEFNVEHFWAGTLGMASSGKDTAGSQWFVTLSAQPHLDGRYTAFGRVAQNLGGVVAQIVPGDRVVAVRVYEGDGSEPLPPL